LYRGHKGKAIAFREIPRATRTLQIV
jgi:hypothetical protein